MSCSVVSLSRTTSSHKQDFHNTILTVSMRVSEASAVTVYMVQRERSHDISYIRRNPSWFQSPNRPLTRNNHFQLSQNNTQSIRAETFFFAILCILFSQTELKVKHFYDFLTRSSVQVSVAPYVAPYLTSLKSTSSKARRVCPL